MTKFYNNGEVYKHVIPQEYTNIILDEEGKANLSQMNRIDGKEDRDRSVETIIGILESEGFEQFHLD